MSETERILAEAQWFEAFCECARERAPYSTISRPETLGRRDIARAVGKAAPILAARIQSGVEGRKSAREREAAVKDSTPAALARMQVSSSIAPGASATGA